MVASQTLSNSLSAAKSIGSLMVKHRSILRGTVRIDEFLTQIGQETASHRFLANSTQAVYSRQVAFLSAVLRDYTQLPANEVKILDWGCGKGHISYLLRGSGFDVVSCDVVSEKSDSAFGQEVPILDKQKISVVPLHHPSQMPFPDAMFDCVVSFGVLEHVPSDVDSLHEIRRVLKCGGIFFITFLPYFLSWTQALARRRGDAYHDRLYHRRRLRALARNAGFHVAGSCQSQFFPKNSMPVACDPVLEPIDRFLCRYTPLKYFATNLEALLVAI